MQFCQPRAQFACRSFIFQWKDKSKDQNSFPTFFQPVTEFEEMFKLFFTMGSYQQLVDKPQDNTLETYKDVEEAWEAIRRLLHGPVRSMASFKLVDGSDFVVFKAEQGKVLFPTNEQIEDWDKNGREFF